MPEHQNLSCFAGGSLQARNLERGFNPRLSSRIRHHLSELHPRRYRMMARTKSLEGEWNELSKAQIASSLVVCFRVQLHSAPEWIRHAGAERRTAGESCSTCQGSS